MLFFWFAALGACALVVGRVIDPPRDFCDDSIAGTTGTGCFEGKNRIAAVRRHADLCDDIDGACRACDGSSRDAVA